MLYDKDKLEVPDVVYLLVSYLLTCTVYTILTTESGNLILNIFKQKVLLVYMAKQQKKRLFAVCPPSTDPNFGKLQKKKKKKKIFLYTVTVKLGFAIHIFIHSKKGLKSLYTSNQSQT